MNNDYNNLTPKEIVKELDKYIIGQDYAKKMVAIAIRNRWRRLQVEGPLKDEITPKNIIMIGPTGVGKTEIARRLANLVNAPFLKVEATKFTEIGYVGKDVESMIRDLMDQAVSETKNKMKIKMAKKAEKIVEEKILDILFPIENHNKNDLEDLFEKNNLEDIENLSNLLDDDKKRYKRTREKLRKKLHEGKFEDHIITIEVTKPSSASVEILGYPNFGDIDTVFSDLVDNLLPKKKKSIQLPVREARALLLEEEMEKLIDMEKVIIDAKNSVENNGIIFIDEIDKIAGVKNPTGPDISREGVQRDILPIIEGTTISTKYGMISTNHILFIAAGAFHVSKPSDLIPEIQGRFPIRVELNKLTENDLRRILIEPKNSLIKQYVALLKTEGIELSFSNDAIDRIAHYTALMNEKIENIGARRLHSIMTIILEDIMFNAPDVENKTIKIKGKDVDIILEKIIKDEDLSKYIL